ncbi:hypothetical protein ACSBR1_000731 [Camellia fascicularis]
MFWVIRRVTRLRGICLESVLSANLCASRGGSGHTTGKLAEIGRCQHDTIEQIGLLKVEIENEKSKAVEAFQRVESESARAAEESARANTQAEKTKSSDQLRLAAVEEGNCERRRAQVSQGGDCQIGNRFGRVEEGEGNSRLRGFQSILSWEGCHLGELCGGSTQIRESGLQTRLDQSPHCR